MQQKNKLIGAIIVINLIVSTSVSFAQSSTGSVDVNPCPTDCISLSAPSSLAVVNTPLFFNNDEARFYLYSNYNLGERVTVSDASPNAQFTLDVSISDLVNTTNSASVIPLANISMLTFNNSSTGSLDGYNGDGYALPESVLDPVYRGVASEPFTQSELSTLMTSASTFDPHFISFSGAGPTSSALNIITADSQPSYLGRYSFGVGFMITLPDNAINDLSLTDGNYQGTLTFTLTEL